MALVSNSIPNLLNGVSQQPAPLRQITQGETQTNALSSVIDGLIKRPPTEHIAEIINTATANSAAIHIIDRGAGNQDILVVNSSTDIAVTPTLEVYTISGTNRTVTVANDSFSTATQNLDYLRCTDPATQLKFITVNDYTIIVNTTITTNKQNNVIPAGATPTSFQLTVNDFSELPDGVNDDDAATVDNAVNGGYYKILSASSNSAQYYVQATGTKTYVESLHPNQDYKIDRKTMPHLLIPDANGDYDYKTEYYKNRTVGDDDSSPFPSFIGNTISNVFFYKNRLGFLSGENVIFSAAGDFFRFFPETVRTVLDDGPIDVTTTHTKASILKQAVAFNDSLTLFSEHTQFTIENVGALTPATISIIPSTEFGNDAEVTPVGAGNYLYFTTRKGNHSSIREYFIEADTVMSDALDITAHVPKYIPKNISKLETSSNEDILVCLSKEDRSKLYVYKWFTDGARKLQSSWSTWELPTGASVLDMSILDSDLYLVVSYSDGTCIEKIDLQTIDDAGLSYCVRLDRKVSVIGTYDSNANETTWTLPYTPSANAVVNIVRSGTWGDGLGATNGSKGADIPVASVSGNIVKASGQYNFGGYNAHLNTRSACLLGISYPMTYEFSPQYVRENNGAQSIQSGRLQMRTMRVAFENTGFFKVEVTPDFRATSTYEYTGVTLNSAGSVIGNVILNDGTFRFPLQSKNDRIKVQIKSDSFLPCAFQSAEWEGFYNIRSKRI